MLMKLLLKIARTNDCYYLEGTYSIEIGALYDNATDTTISKNTESEMKELMKSNLVSLEEWLLDENSGYPILNMQK